MKNTNLLLIFFLLFFLSCDPDVPGEGINLPPLEFAFKVNPDTAYIKVGDTLTLESSISSTLDGGVTLSDGEAILGFLFWYYPYNPITQAGGEHALEDNHYNVVIEEGGFIYNTNPSNRVQDLKTWPKGDSLKIKYHFFFLKKGVYVFALSSKFYEGSKGKTRTSPYFDVKDPHWGFYQIPNNPPPSPGDRKSVV